jgi:uncharacterized protein (TIGR02266 family)
VDPRRSDIRYDRRVEVELEYEGVRVTGVTRNISLGGMYVLTALALPYGARLKLRFHVATQAEPIEVEGQVRWSDTSDDPERRGLGVRFDGLRARDVWALNRFFGG